MSPATKKINPRVIIGATILGLGGIRTHLILLCKLLRSQGVEVSHFYATGSNWDSGKRDRARVQDLGVSFRLPPGPVRGSRQLSVLYSSSAWPMLMPRQAASLYCISAGRSQLLLHRLKPSDAVSINHEIVEPPGADSPAGHCAATLDTTVANSRKVAEMMENFWPQKPIRTIPFLTSDAPTPPPTRRRQVGARDVLRVVYLGRLVEQKRPDLLVRRWPVLSALAGLAPARLDVYGYDPEGKMLKDLRTFVAGSDQAKTVEIHGEYSLSELPKILQACDLVVLPSLWEGLPLVLVEAMLQGVPFVATDAGGTAELGEDNPDVIITSTQWDDFEAGLVQLASRLRAGQINPLRLHAWAEQRYGHEAVSRQWIKCLTEPRKFFDLDGRSAPKIPALPAMAQ